MAYLLVAKIAGPWFPNSHANCRKTVAMRAQESFSVNEKVLFDLINRPDITLGSQDANDLMGLIKAIDSAATTGALLSVNVADRPQPPPAPLPAP